MAHVTRDEEAQVMLLTVFMIVVGVVIYTTILNNMILSSNAPVTGLENSKLEIRNLRLLTEAEVVKAAQYANESNTTNLTEVSNNFSRYMQSFNETITKLYAAKGISVEVVINNVSLNKTAANMTIKKYFVEAKSHTFANGSLIIPMDNNQSKNQSELVRVYGLIYRIVDDKGTEPLNQTLIPVWTILQNPVNSSVPNFSILLKTDNNASTSVDGVIQYRNYSGGPYVIDNDSYLTEYNRNLILDEARKRNITIHELKQDFYYDKSVQMVVPPKVAIYPSDDTANIAVMKTYYEHGDVPYTLLNDSMIWSGALADFDILTIPHHDMYTEPDYVITGIVGWVANGGILHIHCYGTWTMDKAVERWAPTAKPWYGFIGVNNTDDGRIDEKNVTYGKYSDNSSGLNATYRLNSTPLVPLSGLADPGSPFSPLAQNSNTSGMLGTENGLTELFSFRNNASEVNPGANILAYATYVNRTLVYADYDQPLDGKKEAQMIYVEAPYDNGLVSYLAGHNQSERVGGERIIFDTFFAASMRTQLYSAITAKNINITIKYFDGNIRYSDTFLIST